MKTTSILLFTYFLFLLTNFTQAKAETYIHCLEAPPSSFNPQVVTDATTMDALDSTVYDMLVRSDYGSSEIVPDLAESWTVSKDGTEYRFRLRKGVQFQKTAYFTPTRPFNADDVLFSFKRQMNEKHPFHKIGGKSYPIFRGFHLHTLIKEIKKNGDYEVIFKLNQSDAVFLGHLARPTNNILSKEYADQLMKNGKPEEIDLLPVGTGPYSFVSYKQDAHMRFRAHSKHFAGSPIIKDLVMSIVVEPHVRTQKLRVGECHSIALPSPKDYELLKKDKEIKVINVPGFNIGYLTMNIEKPPFDKVKVRRAIALAIDRKSLLEPIFSGLGEVATSAMPSSFWSHQPVIDEPPNLNKAKQLLKEAGYPNGFQAELWTLPVSRPYNPEGKKMGVIMQANLKKIGVDVKLVTYEWGTYLAKTKKGDHQMALLGWNASINDPDNFLGVLLSCSSVETGLNRSRWCNKEYDTLINKARTNLSQDTRAQLYKKAQKIFARELPWLPVSTGMTIMAHRANVKNVVPDSMGRLNFATLRLR